MSEQNESSKNMEERVGDKKEEEICKLYYEKGITENLNRYRTSKSVADWKLIKTKFKIKKK